MDGPKAQEVAPFTVSVYRWLPDREDPAKDWPGHEARRIGLEREFTLGNGLEVTDWGDAKATEAHELVELAVWVTTSGAGAAGVAALSWLGTQLAEKAVDAAWAAGFQRVARAIGLMQQRKESSEAMIEGPDGTRLTIHAPEVGGRWTVQFPDGTEVSWTRN